jgi:outer membrane protein TolC
MLKVKKILIGFLLLLYAQSQAQDSIFLTMDEAISRAISSSEILTKDSLQTRIYSAKILQTKALMMPQINLNSTYTRISNNVQSFSISIPTVGEQSLNPQILNQFYNRFTVQQPIFQGLKPYYTLKYLKSQQSAEALNSQKDFIETKNNILYWFCNLYQLQQSERLLDSSLVKTRNIIKHLENLRDADLILNNDVMRASLEESQLQAQKADIQAAIATANFNLNIWMGEKVDVPNLIPLWQEVTERELPIIDSLFANAYNQRAELRSQQYLEDANNFQQKAAKSAYMPTINMIGNGYYNNPNTRIFPLESSFKATWDVGVSLQWNIMQAYTGKNNLKELQLQQQLIENNRESIKENIAIDVNAQFQNYKKAWSKIALAEQSIVQAKENQRIISNRFYAQLALLSDVLDANYLVLKAETDYLNTQVNLAMSYYNLQKSLGK